MMQNRMDKKMTNEMEASIWGLGLRGLAFSIGNSGESNGQEDRT